MLIRFSAGENTGGNWTPLPEGTYDFRIINAEQTTSKKGSEQLKLELEVLDGPKAGEKMAVWYSLLPQSGWKLRALLEALDLEIIVEGKDADENDLISFDSDELIQRCIRFDVKQRTYEGKVRNDFVNEAPSEYDVEIEEEQAPAEQQQAAPAPTQQAAPSNGAASAGGARRRRPRPVATQ